MNKRKPLDVIKSGNKILTGGASSTIGAVVGSLWGPNGALIGTAVGGMASGVVEVLGDLVDRQLSSREESRLGAGFAETINDISVRLTEGEKLREDDFFNKDYTGRSQSDEILEGVLRRIKDGHEEKMLPYISKIYSNICFDTSVTLSEANSILRTVSSLTFRQLCILRYVENGRDFFDISNIILKLNSGRQKDYEFESLKQEGFSLYQLGLIEMPSEIISEDTEALLGGTDIELDKMKLSSLGRRYYRLMNLKEITKEDLKEIVKI